MVATVLGGSWLLLLLLLLGIFLVTPHAAGVRQQDLPHGWAEESDVRGHWCSALRKAQADGKLLPLFTETNVETMPWGEKHVYEPVMYETLVNYVCTCEEQSVGAGPSWQGKGAHKFVLRRQQELVANGTSFRFVGFNVPQLLSLAAAQSTEQASHTAEVLMRSAATLGLKVARVWAFRDGYDWRPPHYRQQAYAPLQLAPGQYNESMFVALDHILAAAARHGVLVTLTLTNWHRDYGGIEAYVKWARGGSDFGDWTVYDFYNDERVKLLYKAHMCAMVNRRNTVTGVLYRDDPTIFAWDLINEPRCSACPGESKGAVLHAWGAEMSSFMKAIDPNHMVSISSEGYYGEEHPGNMLHNPGLWAVCEGVDFERYSQYIISTLSCIRDLSVLRRLYSLPNIDYAVAHLYLEMKVWDDMAKQECDFTCQLKWSKKWVTGHVGFSDTSLQKPFILEEFGMPKAEGSKDQLFQLVYDSLKDSIKAGRGSVAGSNFWAAAVLNEPDWDGYYLYLDGSLPVATPLGEPLNEAEQDYWNRLDKARERFRRKPEAEKCYAVVKAQYAYLLDQFRAQQKVEYYNQTLEIVVQATTHWNDLHSNAA